MSRGRLAFVAVLATACGPTVAVGGSGESGGSSSHGGATTTTSTSSTATTAVDTVTGGIVPDVGTANTTGEPCLSWADSACAAIPSANAQVMGTTPLAITPPTYAMFASDAGCGGCVVPNVAQVYLVADLAELAEVYNGFPPAEGVVLQLATDFGGFSGPVGQDVVGTITAYHAGQDVQTAATFFLETFPSAEDLADPFDPDAPFVVRGRFAVDQPDWTLTGTFNAAYCPQLDLLAICE